MNSIINTLKTVIPRSMRERLIRKVTLQDISLHENYAEINLSLKNFYNFNLTDKMIITLSNGEYIETLGFTVDKNMLSIQLTDSVLKNTTGNSSIKISVDGKNMIIDSDAGIESQTSFFKEGKYYNILVNGTLVLEHLLAEYTFNPSHIQAESMRVAYENLTVVFPENQNMEHCSLALLYPNKIVELPNEDKGTAVTADDFSNVTMGRATLYIVRGYEMTPVKLDIHEADLTTQNHKLQFMNEDDELVVFIENHEMEILTADAAVSEEEGSIRITMSYDAPLKIKYLVVSDTV